MARAPQAAQPRQRSPSTFEPQAGQMIKIQLPLEIGNARTKLELRRPFRQELLVNKSFRNSKPRET